MIYFLIQPNPWRFLQISISKKNVPLINFEWRHRLSEGHRERDVFCRQRRWMDHVKPPVWQCTNCSVINIDQCHYGLCGRSPCSLAGWQGTARNSIFWPSELAAQVQWANTYDRPPVCPRAHLPSIFCHQRIRRSSSDTIARDQ